jgi:hypothetical protein
MPLSKSRRTFRKNKSSKRKGGVGKSASAKKSASARKSRKISRSAKRIPEVLSKDEIDEIVDLMSVMGPAKQKKAKELLKTLEYEEGYESCFGEKPKYLYEQATQKVQCWDKYGEGSDPIR